MNNIYLIVSSALGITVEEAKINCKDIPELNAYYFWNSQRGERSIIINKNEECLIAASPVKYEDHLKAFISGKRNFTSK